MLRVKHLAILFVCLVLPAGCAQFPKGPVRTDDFQSRCWQVESRDRCDYFQYFDDQGRITVLGYDQTGDGCPDLKVDLLEVCHDGQCPHYVILLDGIPFEMIEQLYREGRFRLFHPPSRLISTFPSMTDLAYSDMLAPGEPLGFEALYLDRERNRLSKGNQVYLSGANASWERYLDYRLPMIYDPVGYLFPSFIFRREMSGMERTFNRLRTGTVMGYTVGTATVGTRKGYDGFLDCLDRIENLCEKIMYERQGRCQITLVSDHGHNLVPCGFFDIQELLRSCGYRVADRLDGPDDVVTIQFGLVTYNALYTRDPERVATCLLNQEQVELAIYPKQTEGGMVVIIRDPQSRAYLTRKGDSFHYQAEYGDPLDLLPIIEQLDMAGYVDPDGWIEDGILFEATVDHEYPDALYRIWRAFDGLAQNAPDLVVTFHDGWFTGRPFFARSVDVASTHGSLNWVNSVTMVMSTIRPLPKNIRIEDLTVVFPEIVPKK